MQIEAVLEVARNALLPLNGMKGSQPVQAVLLSADARSSAAAAAAVGCSMWKIPLQHVASRVLGHRGDDKL